MSEDIDKLLKEMKSSLPNCIGVGLFDLKEGMIIADDIDVPDYDPDYLSASHTDNWNFIKNFLIMLPSDMVGRIQNIVLETEPGFFQLNVLGDEKFLLMGAIENKGNIGILRSVMRKYSSRFESALL